MSTRGLLADLLDPPPTLTATDLMVSAGLAPDPWQVAFLDAAPT